MSCLLCVGPNPSYHLEGFTDMVCWSCYDIYKNAGRDVRNAVMQLGYRVKCLEERIAKLEPTNNA